MEVTNTEIRNKYYLKCKQSKTYDDLSKVCEEFELLLTPTICEASDFSKTVWMQGLLFGLLSVHKMEICCQQCDIVTKGCYAAAADDDNDKKKNVLCTLQYFRDMSITKFNETLEYDWLVPLLFGIDAKLKTRQHINAFWTLLQEDIHLVCQSIIGLCGHIFYLCIKNQHYEHVYQLLDFVKYNKDIFININGGSCIDDDFGKLVKLFIGREFLSCSAREFANKCLGRLYKNDITISQTCRQEHLFDDKNLVELFHSI